jgi:prevent-host-death family protein
MDRRIDAHFARTQFGQIMDRATKNNERFIVNRRGEPAVVIMSVQNFIRTVAPPPDWLEKAWSAAKQRGLDATILNPFLIVQSSRWWQQSDASASDDTQVSSHRGQIFTMAASCPISSGPVKDPKWGISH